MTTSLEHIKRLEDELAQLKEKVAKEETEGSVRWRTPTVHDLLNGSRKCQVRYYSRESWRDADLDGLGSLNGGYPYRANIHGDYDGFSQCRIIDTRPLEGEVVDADDEDIGQPVYSSSTGQYHLCMPNNRVLSRYFSCIYVGNLRKLWPSERAEFNKMMGRENE